MPDLIESSIGFCHHYYCMNAKELMFLTCGVGEDSGESLGLQGDQTR